MESITQQLRQRCIDEGLTYYRLHKLAGIPLGTARQFLRGEVDPKGSTIDAVAAMLGAKVRLGKPPAFVDRRRSQG